MELLAVLRGECEVDTMLNPIQTTAFRKDITKPVDSYLAKLGPKDVQ